MGRGLQQPISGLDCSRLITPLEVTVKSVTTRSPRGKGNGMVKLAVQFWQSRILSPEEAIDVNPLLAPELKRYRPSTSNGKRARRKKKRIGVINASC
jgi:hypothetical protein